MLAAAGVSNLSLVLAVADNPTGSAVAQAIQQG